MWLPHGLRRAVFSGLWVLIFVDKNERAGGERPGPFEPVPDSPAFLAGARCPAILRPGARYPAPHRTTQSAGNLKSRDSTIHPAFRAAAQLVWRAT